MKGKYKVALVKASACRPSGMYAWEWVDANSDFDITVFVSDPSPYSYEDMALKVVKLPILDQRLSLGGITGTRILAGRLNWPTIYLQGLTKCLRASDIVITVEDISLFSLACALKKQYRLVIYTDENIQYPGYLRSRVIKQVRRYIRSRADVFFVTTHMGMRALIYDGVPPERIVPIPYAANADRFFPCPKSLGGVDLPEKLLSGFVVLFVGRVSISKGIPWLLEAARQLIPQHHDLYFLFAGQDELGDDLFRAFLDKFQDQCYWLGNWDHRDMNTIYNLSDVLILPSIPTPNWDEQFGMVLIEAMACGKPAIASHTGGMPYVLSPEGSILVEFMSSEAIERAILTLYQDRERLKQMGAAALKRYRQSYSQEVVGKQIVKALENLI